MGACFVSELSVTRRDWGEEGTGRRPGRTGQTRHTKVAVVTKDDRVHLQPITVSKLFANAVEVAEGISTGDRIVNNPSAALLEGDKVRVVTPASGL